MMLTMDLVHIPFSKTLTFGDNFWNTKKRTFHRIIEKTKNKSDWCLFLNGNIYGKDKRSCGKSKNYLKSQKKHIQSCITNHFDPKFCSTRNTRKSSSLNRFALQEKVSNESINKIRSTEIQIWNYGCSYQIWVFLSTFFDFVIFLYDKPVLFAQRWF